MVNPFTGRRGSRHGADVRKVFGSNVSHASLPFEAVDWSLFDLVGVGHYREPHIKDRYTDMLRPLFAHGKPVVVTEFGMRTYRGADASGALGFGIIDNQSVFRHQLPLVARGFVWFGGGVCVTSGPAGRLPAPARRPVPPACPRVPGAARTTDGPPAAMPRRRQGLSCFREPGADLSGPSSVFLRNASHRTGRVRVRDHPQLAADGCGRPGYPHRLANPGAFRAQTPARVRLYNRTARLQGRGPDVTAAGAGSRTCGRPRGKNRSGAAREVPTRVRHGAGGQVYRIRRGERAAGHGHGRAPFGGAGCRGNPDKYGLGPRLARGSGSALPADAASPLAARRWCGPHRERPP